MSYITNDALPEKVRDALPEGAQTIYRNAYNGAGKQYGYQNEARLSKLAWSTVKIEYDYKQDNDMKWVARENYKIKGGAQDGRATGETHKYTTETWIPIAKEGMEVVTRPELGIDDPAQKRFTLSAEAFKAAEGTWVDGAIKINHGEPWLGHGILEEKFDGKFLYAKFDKETVDELNSAETTGGSIDALVTKYDSNLKATSMVGTGYSLTYAGFNPRCTFEMGCGGIKNTIDDIPTDNKNMGLDHVESQLGGGLEDMAEEEVEQEDVVTYTSAQLNERVAGAVAERNEIHENALKVAVSEATETQKVEDEKVIAELKTEKEASEAIIEAQADAALKERRATFMQRNDIKEDSELIKQWDALTSVEDAQILMNTIEYSPQQIAGASSGSVAEEKAEAVTKLEVALTKLGNKYSGGKL